MGMAFLVRFGVWALTAGLTVAMDLVTKGVSHSLLVEHYAPVPPLLLLLVGVFLVGLGLRYSVTLAVGSGLMFGGLVGNGSQLILYGYASDWIPVAGWLTNIADIADAVGLVCCCAGYVRILQLRHAGPRHHAGQF